MDDLSAFNVAPNVPQFTAPYAPVNNIPPEYTGAAPLPGEFNYAPTTPIAPPNTSLSTNSPNIPHPPSFLTVLQDTENRRGKLSPDDFDKLVNDYRTNIALPTLERQKGAKKDAVTAEMAAFDNNVAKLRASRYSGNSTDSNQSAAGAFTRSFGGTLGSSAAGLVGELGGGIASGFGLFPNNVANKLYDFGNPNIIAGQDQQGRNADQFAQIILGHNYNDPKYAQLRAKIISDFNANHNTTSLGGASTRLLSQVDRQNHPNAAFLGSAAGTIAPFLIPGVGLATGGAGLVGQSAQNASGQLLAGQNQSDVEKQLIADNAINLLTTAIPGGIGGNVLKRALLGGGLGAGTGIVQQYIDAAVNPNNTPNLEDVGKMAALQAVLAALHAGRAPNPLKRPTGSPEAAPEASGQAPSSGSTPPPSAGAAQGDQAPSTTHPVDFYRMMLDSAPKEGMQDNQFNTLEANILEEANKQAKKYKTAIANANTPERTVQSAWALAQKLSGDNWSGLSGEQRDSLIGTLANWIGKKSKVSADDISSHLQSLRNPPADTVGAGNAQPSTVQEQPLPSDITGEQVPGTVSQEPAPQSNAQPAIQVTPENTALWDALSNPSNTDVALKKSPLYQRLKPAVDAGKINSAEELQNIMDKAKALSKQKKSNALKSADTTPEPKGAERTILEDNTSYFNPTAARNAADAAAAKLGIQPVQGAMPDSVARQNHPYLPLDKSHDVIYSGAVTLDGKPESGDSINGLAFDKNYPNYVRVGKTVYNPGILIDAHWATAQHEIYESWLMHHYGMDYPTAHKLATEYENQVVQQRYGIDPKLYQKALQPSIQSIEKARGQNQPQGLDAKPYNDSGEGSLANPTKSPNALKASAKDNHKAVAETVTEALSDNSTTETQKNKLKAKVKEQSEKKYNQSYLRALMNENGVSTGPEEDAIRADPRFLAARAALHEGKITNANELGLFLKKMEGTDTLGDISDSIDPQLKQRRIGELLSTRSNKSNITAAKKYARDNILGPLIKLGEKEAEIRKMTLAQAENHLQRLANTFTNVEPEPTPPKPKGGGKLKSKKKETATSPKPKAPAQTTGASEKNSLETELYSRFGDKIPSDDLDKLHDAILEASDTGDKLALNQHIKDLQDSGYIDSNDTLKIRYLANKAVKLSEGAHNDLTREDLLNNNASGESSASLEAQRRLADEKAAGQIRMLIDRDGTVRPLEGVDAVDTHARRGQVIVQRGIGREPWTVLSHGEDLSSEVAQGKVNRARSELDNYDHSDNPERFGEHTLNMDDVEEYAQLRDKIGDNILDKRTPLNVTHRVGKIIEKIQDGADTREVGNELLRLREDLQDRTLRNNLNAMKGRRRGPEWFRAKLAREIADNLPGSRQRYAMEFADWLLQKNPNLVDDVAISVRELKERTAGGYNPVTRLISISSTAANESTVVHEILHAAETMMPEEIQNGIRGEYVGRIINKLKQQKNNPVAREYLQTAISNFMHPSKELRDKLYDLLKNNRDTLPVDDFYKYFSPSEYWAEEGSAILQRRYGADSWIGKAKNWLTEFTQHIKNLLGLDNNSKVLKGLKTVLHPDAGPEPVGMLDNTDTEYRDIPENDAENESLGYEPAEDASKDSNLETTPKIVNRETVKDLSKVTTAQHAIEQTMRADYGLEKAMQIARAKGIEITNENNVEDAAFTKNGLVSEYNSKDFDEAFNPVSDLLYQMVHAHAKNMGEFVDKLNKFFQNTHWLERIKTDWIHESPLDGTAEIDRADILDKIAKDEIDPMQASKQLADLANKHAKYTWQEWAEHNGVPLDVIQEQLDKLDKESNINQKTMSELNSLMDLARQRQQYRLQEAGLVDKNDPWIKVYNWKWYVPLKGSAYGGAPDNNFDLIPARRLSLGKLNKQMQVMEGRKSFAERPFTRLFVDMARAGERQGNSYVLDRLYNLAVEHPKEIGAKIHTFTGRQKDGYTNTKTGEFVAKLKAPAHGVIVNDGDTHYVIELPPDSQLLRGLIQMNNVERPNKLERFVGRGTNVLARLYTTVSPTWQTFTGFIREFTYQPLTIGATRFDNPLQAVPFFAKYTVNAVESLSAFSTLFPHLLGQSAKLREMGEANPNSWAGWTRRYEKAGGINQFTKGFDIPSMERLFSSKLQEVDGVLDASKWGWNKILEYTGNYANLLETMPRVAAFKTLVEEGYSDTDAAVQVRKVLDYSQSGIKGRRINSWLAFFRVGMTSADAMRRAFTTPTGEFNYVKLAKWQGFIGALGAIGYMAGTAMLGKDDDGKDKIAKLNPDTLTSKIVFPFGDKIAGVNLGLGLPQILMAPGILAMAVGMGHMDAGAAAKAYWKMLLRNGPISPGGAKGDNPTDFAASFIKGFVPTVVRPIVDVSTNTTSFDSSVHTDIDNNSKYHSDQGRSTTPHEFKEMADWLREVTDNKIDMYPEDIRYLIQNYGGQLATDFVKSTLSSPDEQAGAGPEPSRMAGKFIINDAQHYMQNELYDTLDKLNDSQRRYNAVISDAKDNGATDAQAKAQANQMLVRDPEFRKEVQAYKLLDAARRDYQNKIKQLRANRLISDTRKQLERKRLDSALRQAIEKAQTAIPQ